MSRFLPLLVAGPLVGAAIGLLLGRRRAWQRALSVGVLGGGLVFAIVVMAHVESTGHAAVAHLGGWPASIGITYVADRLACLMLVIAFLTLLVVDVFAIGQRAADESSPYYHPIYLVLAGGLAAAFLAGDLFHLFVAFEVLLMSSYVLLTLNGTTAQVRAGTTYVVLNVVESLVLVVAVGSVYAATGSLNMAELPGRLAELDSGVRTGLQLLLLVAFGMKAAVFPLFFWLPDSYPAAAGPVTAIFAGLLTKVGVYSLIRTQTLLFPGTNEQLLLVVAGLTMVIGVLGAIAQGDVKRILSFHIVSQIGYMVFGLALGGPAAIAATLFFLLHQIPIKTSLFLVEGIIERVAGSSGLDDLGGLARRSGPLAACFLLPALSLAGLPPFSGFVGKLGIIGAGVDHHQYLLVGVALAVSLCTLVSMTKIWLGAFWGEPPEGVVLATDLQVAQRHPTMLAATAALVAVGLALAVASGPIYAYCERAAAELTSTTRYAAEVARP